MNIEGEYKIKIFKDGKWFLAEITCPDGYTGMTQGKDEQEILEMTANWIMSAYEVPYKGWIKKLIEKL